MHTKENVHYRNNSKIGQNTISKNTESTATGVHSIVHYAAAPVTRNCSACMQYTAHEISACFGCQRYVMLLFPNPVVAAGRSFTFAAACITSIKHTLAHVLNAGTPLTESIYCTHECITSCSRECAMHAKHLFFLCYTLECDRAPYSARAKVLPPNFSLARGRKSSCTANWRSVFVVVVVVGDPHERPNSWAPIMSSRCKSRCTFC